MSVGWIVVSFFSAMERLDHVNTSLMLVSLLCSSEHGRDCICDPNERRAILLGCNLSSTRKRAFLFMDHRLVSNRPSSRL